MGSILIIILYGADIVVLLFKRHLQFQTR